MIVADEELAPGRSTEVVVKWKAKNEWGPFREMALLRTNDPDHARVTLTITGQIVTAVKAVPSTLAFGRLSQQPEQGDHLKVAEIPVYCFLGDEPLRISSHRFLSQSTAENFQVLDIEPLSAERLAEEPDAISGCLVRVAVKSGLPLGEFQQTIELTTNQEPSPTVKIPLVGMIGKDFSIFGKGWDGDVLNLGVVTSPEGIQRDLYLIGGGPYHKEVKFTLAPPTPDLLQVELGETTEYAPGKASRTTITIRIPPGSRSVNHLGSGAGGLGLITILADHPEVADIKIRVRFAVRGE